MRGMWVVLMIIWAGAAVVQAQEVDTLSYYQGSIAYWAEFPNTSGGDHYDKAGMMVTPLQDGVLLEFAIFEYVPPFSYTDGDFLVTVYSNTYGGGLALPGAPLTGTMAFDAADFNSTTGWNYLDISPLGFTFSAGDTFHVVWEYVPETDETFHTLLTDEAPPLVSSMHQVENDSWGYWFAGAGDALEAVVVEYTGTVPAALSIQPDWWDMGQVETGADLVRPVDLINSGGEVLTISNLVLTNPEVFSFQPMDLPLTILPLDTVTVDLIYNSLEPGIYDTTSLVVEHDGQVAVSVSSFWTRAGATDAEWLSNEWMDDPGEPVWYQTSFADTTEPWALYSGFHRSPWFAGHFWSYPADSVADLLWTVIPNPDLSSLEITFAQNQLSPEDTQLHHLWLGHVEQDTVYWNYYFDLTEITVEDNLWHYVAADAGFLFADSLCVGFFYAGSYADAWYLDDVALNIGPDLELDISENAGNVEITWQDGFAGVVNIYSAPLPYGPFTYLVSVPASTGMLSLPVDTDHCFYRATLSQEEPGQMVHLTHSSVFPAQSYGLESLPHLLEKSIGVQPNAATAPQPLQRVSLFGGE